MKNVKRVLPVCLAVLLWAALLAPFFLGAFAAHPATDDFTFATYTRPTWLKTGSILHVVKDALSYAVRTWRDWQGTVTGVIIMALGPAVFTLKYYGVHAVILLVLHLAALFVFLKHMLQKRMGLNGKLFAAIYLLLSCAQMLFLPDIVEGIYWFNGAWFYTGANAVALLTLTLADRCSTRESGIFSEILCVLLLFALGMDNYITAMMTAAALFMMAFQRFWAKEKKEAVHTALLLVPIGVGLLLSVLAPGNKVRMAVDGAHQSGLGWLVSSILWTFRDAAWFLIRFLIKTPLLSVLLVLTPVLCRFLNENVEEKNACPPIGGTIAGTYLILCAMIIPHMYSSGYAGSGRVVNMYHLYVLTALPLAQVLILKRLKCEHREAFYKKRGLWAGMAAAALLFCLMGGQLGNYQKLVADQLDGTQAAYIAQFKNEYALCEAAGAEDDVALPAWTVQTVTGKPTAFEDATVWTNEAMASYFDVKRVYVQP